MEKTIIAVAFTIVALISTPMPSGHYDGGNGIQAETSDSMSQIVSKASAAEGDGVLSVREVWVTAYSSSPDETDNTPFETASMTSVREGIIAANFLPFGTKVLIPELFGDTIFVVEDRMHERKKDFIDIWMPSKEEALRFGINRAEIVILNEV